MMAQIQEDKYNLAPKKFNMWIFIFTSFMFFAALTSGFIVYTGGREHAINIILPKAFMYSTTVIIVSSITMFIASRAAKRLEFAKQRLFLWLTLALGVLFFAIQIYGWSILIKMGVYFINPNASQSFIYVFTGMHLVHIFAGLLLIINTLWRSYKNVPQAKNLFGMEMSGIFWHFVDIIWIYLYVFLLLNQY
ncbi:cytochrome c oxidase subunit 3 [Mucilaginibacter sp. E4BP6]|uniref:cytochrome c oxidase subunit 3 n=1 Tax=Mucilaginibacter sp. E4BP6 TaxID=2723089 RepID=UPI0018113E1E|nr:cytochrome c oxidase subunit 3 [Mucilaginibacter sp. E4BP6]NYE68517.1 cytochrome c oxidase subunit 3 [Mucilaginibacter sp. E4BP6]